MVEAPITPEHYEEAKKYLMAMMTSVYVDFRKDIDSHGEQLTLVNFLSFFFYFGSPLFKSFARGVVRLLGFRRFASVLGMINKNSPRQYEKLMKSRQEFCYKFSELWKKNDLDVVISPAYPHCAYPSDDAKDLGLTYDYTFLWSALEYPAGVLTVTKVLKEE